jgi:hypothetical protein
MEVKETGSMEEQMNDQLVEEGTHEDGCGNEDASFKDAFRKAVEGINFELVLDQLDLEEWMPEWLEEERDCDPEVMDYLDYREIALRGIWICAAEARRILISEYGLKESDFVVD